MPRTIAFFVCGLLASICLTGEAWACACCASTGQRHVAVAAMSDYETDVLSRIAFADRAELFTAEADSSDIRGLSAPGSDFALAVARNGADWTFTFRDGATVAGTLHFATPSKLAKFEVDTRADTPPEGGMVTLYKEWKLTAPVRATGMFKLTQGSSASLILQGQGNGCSSAEDFRHWTLVVQGDGFAFHFFGDLAKPR